MDGVEQRNKIYINPEFRKVHINPNFLPKNLPTTSSNKSAEVNIKPNNIHFNPAFFEKLRIRQLEHVDFAKQNNDTVPLPAMTLKIEDGATIVPQNPIIKHTKRKLIRASVKLPMPIIQSNKDKAILAPLLKIGRNKLVRSNGFSASSSPPKSCSKINASSYPPTISSKVAPQRYKLDRRPTSIVRRYSLVRKATISPQKVVITDRKLLKLKRVQPSKITKTQTKPFTSCHKKLVMVNINGLLYKSSNNKLQVAARVLPIVPTLNKDAPNVPTNTEPARGAHGERTLTIRGARFLLDSSGMKLRKVESKSSVDSDRVKLGRIDIGGLTYLPKTDGTFVRSNVHRARSHLSFARQKSIQVLANKMRKCNVPCQIYRRLGKCSSFEKGKCLKLHDPKHVIICPRFLKGNCSKLGCLLSHNVTFEKMPVCRFFLEGRCSKADCPYLHKKVSEKERVCEDFVKGFCPLADKCSRRHEFICPEQERLGVCNRTQCPYSHGKGLDKSTDHSTRTIKNLPPPRQDIPPPISVNATPLTRYYLEDPNASALISKQELDESEKTRLKRMLRKVEAMKEGRRDKIEGPSFLESNQNPAQKPIESSSDSEDEPLLRKRAKLGSLPSFIPI